MDSKFESFKSDIFKEFFALTKEAEIHRKGENDAAVCIQSYYRRYVVQKSLRELHESAIVIQKYLRGYLARKLYHHLQLEYTKSLRRHYFNHSATTIQRWFRGFLSRKYKHNFHARKAYIDSVTEKANAIVDEMRINYHAQVEHQVELETELAQHRFGQAVRRLHHLVSTESCPGIFNSPYTALTGGPPMISGVPVEAFLRSTRKGNFTKKPQLQLTEKDFVSERSFMEAKEHYKEKFSERIPRKTKPFIAAGNPFNNEMSAPSVRASTPYKSAIERAAHAKATAARGNISQKPFITALKKGCLFEDTLVN